MESSSGYIVAARAVDAYDALAAVAHERRLVVVHADVRHLTLAFRPDDAERGGVVVFAAVLDAGHGLSKLVVTGRDDRGGSPLDIADLPAILFADVERRLRSGAEDRTDTTLVSS